MVRLPLFPFLVLVQIFESMDVNYSVETRDLFTSDELSKLTDIYYQFCLSNKCDNTTHVPEVEILKPSVSICCYPQCSCETCNYGTNSGHCCPEVLNKLDSYPTCVNSQLKPWNPSQPIYQAFEMQTTCAARATIGDKTADKCQFSERFNELDTKIPVADSSFTKTFANLYCAKCSSLEYIPWTPIIVCKEGTFEVSPIESIVERVQQSENCTLYFKPPDLQNQDNLISCGPYISECNMTGNWKTYDSVLESGCRAMYAPFQNRYRNVFCFLCNSDEIMEDMPSCTWPPYVQPSISLALAYPITYNVSHGETNGTACGEYGLYDPFQDSCLEVKCLLYKMYIGDGKCQRTVERVGGTDLAFRMFLKFTPLADVAPISSVMNRLFVNLMYHMEKIQCTIPEVSLIKLAYGHRKKHDTKGSNMGNKTDYILIIYAIPLPTYWNSMVQLSSIEALLKLHGDSVSLEGPGKEQIPFLIGMDTVDSALEADEIIPYRSIAADEFDYLNSKMETLLPVQDCPLVELDLQVYNLTNGRLGVMNDRFSTAIGRNEYLLTNNGTSILTCIDIYQSLVSESVITHSPLAGVDCLKCTFQLYFLAFVVFFCSVG